MNQADVAKLISQLKFKIKPKHRKFACPKGPEERLNKMRKTVTALIKHERIELNSNRADESRGYAERLISDAIRHGDGHAPTMEMVDYWITEKQYIHKLFKVLVPRFQNYNVSFTRMYKAPQIYPVQRELERAVLELRGNPYPPLKPDQSHNRKFIHNVLLEEARKEYRKEKYAQFAANLAPLSETDEKAADDTNTTASSHEAQVDDVNSTEPLPEKEIEDTAETNKKTESENKDK